MSDPFFLLGAERAGMMLVETMLAAHAELRWGGDFDYALEWQDAESSEWPPLIPYWQHLAFSKRARQLGLRIDPALDMPSLLRSLLAQQRGERPGPFGVAVHAHYERVLRLWPSARFIYVARSSARTGGAPDLEQRRASDLAWRRIASRIDASRRIELRYETLLTHLPTELARVCGFLGVSFDPEILRIAPSEPATSSEASPASPGPSLALRFAQGLGLRLSPRLRG